MASFGNNRRRSVETARRRYLLEMPPEENVDPLALPKIDNGSAANPKSICFRGVAIREYSRILGDNPSADNGAPLGLDWDYRDVRRVDSDDNSDDNNSTIIPMDDYEQESERRKQKIIQRRASTHDNFDELSEEQIKQLSARWLKIQPLTWKTRQKILLREANTSPEEIEAVNKKMRRLQSQRNSTRAMAETGLDEWQEFFQLLKRRFRRFRSGISKKQEQELLWEKAKKYRGTTSDPNTTSNEKTEDQAA